MKKIVIGISGGIDSAVCAALCCKIIGSENVLLVNMPGQYNSNKTKTLARKLADNLGCLYMVMPIQEAVDLTIKQLETTPIINLSDNSSHTLFVSSFIKENIQARDRSARILASVAAIFGGGFTCNANKSELTIGYSTFYGDLAGFLAPIADLWKHQVYELGEYLNKKVYQRELIPQEIFNIVPSAELSPEQNIEAGKGDPLCYPYHDYLFKSFIEHWNKRSPEDILCWYMKGQLEEKIGCQPGIINKLFPTVEDFILDLERWWILFSGMAVAKRIQAPPILAISRRAYGFDHRESQLTPYFTRQYLTYKKALLSK